MFILFIGFGVGIWATCVFFLLFFWDTTQYCTRRNTFYCTWKCAKCRRIYCCCYGVECIFYESNADNELIEYGRWCGSTKVMERSTKPFGINYNIPLRTKSFFIRRRSAVQKRSNLKTLTHRICWQHSKRDYLIQIILWWMCYCIVLNRWSIDLVQLVGRWIESEFQIEVEMEESIKLNALIIIDAVSAKIEDNKWSGEIRQFQV